MSDTPRTDAEQAKYDLQTPQAYEAWEWARKLERELPSGFFSIFKCWLHGHETPPDCYGDNTCTRCKQFVFAGEALGVTQKLKYWWRYDSPQWIHTRYYRKCHDCGKRFNNHTPECPPF